MNAIQKPDRIHSLRAAEQQCYSICMHLLKDEQLAVKAAQEALFELYCEDTVANRELVKKIAIRHALKLVRRPQAAEAAVIA
ncbi:hypothetical protein M3223_00355 [Paenibacillus pasadenensis]|uniref:hypothetical protein n=1 Tax=Paenibacillus pasadenensis TaxID=217090 RepID=UPI00203BE4CC|nr:hypothetical protein [Paenibacillus pasadenensis]MCM3745793.1 hypothetical protein [Paenibacillus pasadenensis]